MKRQPPKARLRALMKKMPMTSYEQFAECLSNCGFTIVCRPESNVPGEKK